MIRFLLLALLSSTFTFFTISWLASEFPYDLNRLLATLTHTCNVIIITNIVEPTKLETISLRGKLIFAITHSGAAVCWRLSGQYSLLPISLNLGERDGMQMLTVLFTGCLFLCTFIYHLNRYVHTSTRGMSYMALYLGAGCTIAALSYLAHSQGKIVHFHHHAVALAFAYGNTSRRPLVMFMLSSSMGIMTEGLTVWGEGLLYYDIPPSCGYLRGGQRRAIVYYNSITCNSTQPIALQLCSSQVPLGSLRCTSS